MMEYWKLREHPFVEGGESPFFYPAAEHVQAFNRFKYLVDTGTMRFGCATGEGGVGKTSLLMEICQECSADARYIPAYFGHGSLSPRDLMAGLVRLFDRHAAWERFSTQAWSGDTGEQLTLFAELMRNKVLRLDRHIVACIDAAQHASPALITVCQAMAAVGSDAENGITFIFAATPDGCDRLVSMPDMQDRLGMICDLPALTDEECGAYIDARMQHAGYRGVTLFDAAARKAIYEYSAGVPRDINRICTMALERGMVFKERFISADTVYSAMETVLGQARSA